ncbi:MAG: serine--tRNA ligase [Campylobacterales bacterium]|nr:serine--tRNA ligase [Campylobacterales bacterium]
MIDIKLVQNEFDKVSENLSKRGVSKKLLEELKKLSLDLKAAKKSFEEKKAEQNQLSKQFGVYKKEGKDIGELQGQIGALKEEIGKANEAQNILEEDLNKVLLQIPNLVDDSVPVGADEEENVEIKKVLTPPSFDFEPKAHYEIGEKLGWLNFEKGVKLAKSRFTVLQNEAAKLERALINYMLDFNKARGFDEVWLPAIVNREAMTATGQLPKFEEDLYRLNEEAELPENDLFLIPTAEVPLVNLFRDEILKEEELPIKMTAYTPCFRKEAGSAGRDTRGMIRQHQFDKVELVTIATPEKSDKIYEEMIACASDLLTSLGLAHRHVQLCTGDLGFGANKTTDLEVWIPSEDRYREISSISNVGDFQGRRAKIRYKKDKKNTFVHTLNGSSLAVGRTLIAIMENFQNPDGTVEIPEVLKEYIK